MTLLNHIVKIRINPKSSGPIDACFEGCGNGTEAATGACGREFWVI